jgi:regulator of protease activity HflC (stomatin/prohibitin superfamily)
LTEKKDISDHFRTFQFQYATHIMGAETKDKIPLDLIGIAELIVTRPYLTAYYAERWDILAMAWIKDKVNDKTKSLTLDEVLASDDANKRAIQEAVTNITGSEEVFGIVFKGFRILEINPQLDAEGLKKIQAEAFANQQAKATRKDGQARADVVVMMAKASGSQAAQRALAAETQIKTAEAAGDGAIIYLGGGQQQTDTTQMAILAELRKLNKDGKKPEPNKGGTE